MNKMRNVGNYSNTCNTINNKKKIKNKQGYKNKYDQLLTVFSQRFETRLIIITITKYIAVIALKKKKKTNKVGGI